MLDGNPARRDPEPMEPRTLIWSGIAASIAVHVLALFVVLSLADVRLFGSNATEPITVDLVSPDEAPPAPEIAAPAPPPPAQQTAEGPDPPQPAQPPTPPTEKPSEQASAAQTETKAPAASSAAVQPAAPPVPQQPTQPPPEAAIPQPEPDLSVKYPVMFGLPVGGDFDSRADSAANIGKDNIAAFRRHLAGCSALPPGIGRNDRLRIVIRVVLAPNGTLLASPTLIEASASAKGPALMQGAIDAVTKCEPYTMLPADKYNEWKILDLSFTPQDLAGG
jgi:hypothetical protein